MLPGGTHTDVYRFGPFEFDAARRRLVRGRDAIALPGRHAEVLLLLAANAGHTVTKEAIVARVWQDTPVTDNTIERAVWNLRKALGAQPDGASYIETRARLGYRFAAPVERADAHQSEGAIDAVVAPHLAFIEGRAALETFDCDAIVQARQAFEAALRKWPHAQAAHIGMANACVLAFESTRADLAPDVAALEQADRHAREARRLNPSSAEAWATLAFVMNRTGSRSEAIAAARQAITLEPNTWPHHLRHACVSWGDERLRAAERVVALCSDLALAHWFAATVFVARQAFGPALDHVRAGCAAQDAQRKDRRRFHAVGLHLLHGLILLARGDDGDSSERALEEFTREIELCDERQLYARESAANASYAQGALYLRQQRHADAEAAFHAALAFAPGHACALVATRATSAPSSASPSSPGFPPHRDFVDPVDTAIVQAVALSLAGQHTNAAQVCGDALAKAEPSAAGWLLPVEPVLNVAAHRGIWAEALATLRHGAA